MKRLLLLPLSLLLIACEPTDEPQPIQALQEVSAQVETSMLPYYPYFKNWDICEINGEMYEDVTFMYTDLGLGYMVDGILYYRLEMEVTYCKGVIVEGIND